MRRVFLQLQRQVGNHRQNAVISLEGATGDDTSVHGDQFPIGCEGDTILRNERPAPGGGGAWAGAPPEGRPHRTTYFQVNAATQKRHVGNVRGAERLGRSVLDLAWLVLLELRIDPLGEEHFDEGLVRHILLVGQQLQFLKHCLGQPE